MATTFSKNKPLKILSIDFDFFENCQNLKNVSNALVDSTKEWKRREMAECKRAEEIVPWAGPSFSKFLSHFDLSNTVDLRVGNDHSQIISMLLGTMKCDSLEICNVDAHHDLYYLNIDLKPSREWYLDCGNWGLYLIRRKKVKWTQVYPSWRTKSEGEFELTKSRLESKFPGVEIKRKSLDSLKFAPDYVFLCRSDDWVPPQYDLKFDKLFRLIAKKGKFDISTLGDNTVLGDRNEGLRGKRHWQHILPARPRRNRIRPQD